MKPEPGRSDARSLLSVGKGATVMVVSTILLLLFNFGGRVAVARAFNPAAWGDYSVGLALTQFLAITALLGLHQAIARTISFHRDTGTRRKLLRFGLLVSVVASAVVSSAVWLLAGPLAAVFNKPQLEPIFQLFSITIGFTLLSTFFASIFQGFEDAAPNAWFNQVINPGLFLLFVFVALFVNAGFTGVLLAYVISNAIAFAALAVYTAIHLPQLVPSGAPEPSGLPPELFGLSISLWGVTSFQFVTAYVDTLILAAYRDSQIVGLYSSAMTLARLLLVGNGALTYIYLPVAARLKREGNYDAIRSTYVTGTRWILAITVPMLFLFAFLPSLSLRAVFGSLYTGGAVALDILVVGSFLSVIEGPANSCLAGMGYARSLLLTTVLSALVNLVLSFALIPTYGLLGAAIAWSVARAIYPGVGAFLLWRSDRITPFRRILTIPLAVTILVGSPIFFALEFVHLGSWTVVPLFFLGTGIYIGAVLVTRSVERGDLLAFRALQKRLGLNLPRLDRFMERYVSRIESPLPGP